MKVRIEKLVMLTVSLIFIGQLKANNLALEGSASQSSLYKESDASGAVTEYDASRAIDGNTNGDFYKGSVTATKQDDRSWWQVNLGESYDIGSVVLYNRTDQACQNYDKCRRRLKNFTVELIPYGGFAGDASNITQHYEPLVGEVVTIPFAMENKTRTVRITLADKTNLSLAEVEVYQKSFTSKPGLFINKLGSVGIGIEQPEYALDVFGSVFSRISNHNNVYIGAGSKENTSIIFDQTTTNNSQFVLQNATGEENFFGLGYLNNGDQIKMNPNGDVSIGGNGGRANVSLNGYTKFNFKHGRESHQIEISRPSGDTGIVFNSDQQSNRSRFDMRNDAHKNVSSRHFIMGYADKQDQFVLSTNGNIGIGTRDTAWNPLTVAPNSNGAAIYTTGLIYAKKLKRLSDARIKNITGVSSKERDLGVLRQIEVTDYTLKGRESINKKNVKMLIGQQVHSVYPEAVTLGKGFVGDIMQNATVEGTTVLLNNHPFSIGERLKIISSKNREYVVHVLAVTPDTFDIDKAFQGDVLIYGREVSDFHSVDYSAVAMLNVSATQFLIEKVERLEKENKSLSDAIYSLQEKLCQELSHLDFCGE